MNNGIFNSLKIMELTRFFITQYNYREVEIKNVEGVFIENRLAKYPLIRISSKQFNDIAEFNEDLAIMNKVLNEYSIISQIEQPNCLAIYFDGIIEEKVNNIYSVVIKDNNDIAQSSILSSEYPLLSTTFNLDRVNEAFKERETLGTNNGSSEPNEKKITDMFSIKEINKKTKFTRYFSMIFLAVNFMAIFMATTTSFFTYEMSFYNVFFVQLGQFYRLFTGLFINDSILYVFCFAYFFYRYNSYVEVKLGTKKTAILYGVGILIIFATMIFASNSAIYLGSYPLLALLGGAYLATVTLPSERAVLKFNTYNIITVVVILIVFGLFSTSNLITGAIGLLSGAALVYALNLKEKPIKKEYLASMFLIVVVMIGLRFLPNQTLNRAYQFEQNYVMYESYNDKSRARSYQEKMDDYYKKMGVIDYDE